MTNFKQLLTEHNISFTEKGKHSAQGWIQVQCPFCIDTSSTKEKYHGGINLEQEYYNCWKCNWHPLKDAISAILNVPIKQAKIILKKYKGEKISQEENEIIEKKQFCFPLGCKEMTERHRNYLLRRNFDPYKLEREWNLMGTNHHGNYKLRVIAPIYLDGKVVSFQGRDITGKHELKYKACRIDTEIVHHKHIVYGFDKLIRKDRCIIVEGITDVWRMGVGSVATFGIGFTLQQVLFLAKRGIKLAFIMFDPEEKAQEQAEKLACQLQGFGIEAQTVDISKEKAEDPGTLPEIRAKEISKELLK